MNKIFISYASVEQDFAYKTCKYLEKTGKSCWIAPRNITTGNNYGAEIIKGLEECNVLVLLFSAASNDSQHVLREVERAVSKNIPIIVYRLDETIPSKSMEYFLFTTQWLNASKNPSSKLSELNESIERLFQENAVLENDNQNQEKAVVPDASIAADKIVQKKKRFILPWICTGVFSVMAIVFLILTATHKKPTDSLTGKQSFADTEATEAYGNEDAGFEENISGITSNEPQSDFNDLPADKATSNMPDSEISDNGDTDQTGNSDHSEPKEKDSNNNKDAGNQPKDDNRNNDNTKDTETGNPDAPKNADDKKPTETTNPNPSDQTDDKTGNDTNQKEPSDKKGTKASSLKVGDYITFGHYFPSGYTKSMGDGLIRWQVICNNEDSLLLLSEDILDVRVFDAAESGKFDKDSKGNSYDREKLSEYSDKEMREYRGNNNWEKSDVCAWLNSDGVVKYQGKVPVDAATDDHANANSTQKGFLSNFSKKEKSILSGSQPVHLLSLDEIKRYVMEKENKGISLYARLTEAAAASDHSTWSSGYREYSDAFLWSTSTEGTDQNAASVLAVSIPEDSNTFKNMYAAASGHGIRPAILIQTKDVYVSGDGSVECPYSIK